ncbi:MAG: phosphatidylglycerophosphatase A [Thermoanaerobaculales bacterium]
MSRFRAVFTRLIATSGGLGDLLPAPGTTAGSLPAAVLWWLACLALPDTRTRILLTTTGLAVVLIVGTWASAIEAQRRGKTDPGPIVVDEVAGQWLTYLPALPFLGDSSPTDLGLAAVAGFLLFRFFDIVKPWPVRQLEQLPGGFGIMVDDLAAAIYSGACLVIAIRLFS